MQINFCATNIQTTNNNKRKEKYQPKRLAQRKPFEIKQNKGKREMPRKSIQVLLIEKMQAFIYRLQTSLDKNNLNNPNAIIAKSLDDSAIEIDLKRRDEIEQALINGDYDTFRKSEFAHISLDEFEALFNFDNYNCSIKPATSQKITGKPAHTRKNKSLTLNYLRKSDTIEIKKFIEYMKQDDFGTVFPESIDNLVEWLNFKNGTKAGYRKNGDVIHNMNLTNLKVELQNAYSSLHAPKGSNEKILIFPNGEKCTMTDFLNRE